MAADSIEEQFIARAIPLPDWVTISLAATFASLCAHGAEAQHLWHTVPGFSYIQVDQASIHRDRPALPPQPLHLRPPDTMADVKIDGRIYPKQEFWCVPRGSVYFNAARTSWVLTVWPPNPEPREGRMTKEALDAVEHLVCVDMERRQ